MKLYFNQNLTKTFVKIFYKQKKKIVLFEKINMKTIKKRKSSFVVCYNLIKF